MSARVGLAALAPQSPRRVLEELVARGRRAAAAGHERPAVSLELLSGRSLAGRCVAVADDGGLSMVLLHTGGSERAPQVVQVRLDQVAAVGYEPVSQPQQPTGAAPGRLELARGLAGVAEEVTRVLGARFELVLAEPAEDAGRQAVAALVPVLRQALVRLAADAMGKDALRTLAAVQVGAGPRRAVTASGGSLRVEGAEEVGQEWTVSELVAAIEKAL